MGCAAPLVYTRTGSACPATCADPNAPDNCPFADTEVCVCPDGKMLENGKCIERVDCGCIDSNGIRHKVQLSLEVIIYPISAKFVSENDKYPCCTHILAHDEIVTIDM